MRGRNGGHLKYRRQLPLSGRTQTVTLPSTPSDAIRGIHNTAADLVTMQRQAAALEQEALDAQRQLQPQQHNGGNVGRPARGS